MSAFDLHSLLGRLEFHPVVVGPDLKIKAVSSRLLRTLGYDREEARRHTVLRFLSMEFFQDLFVRRKIWEKPFKNYRALLRSADGKTRLYQISGYRDEDGYYRMILQDIDPGPGVKIDTGNYEVNLRAHQLMKRYISRQLIKRARSAVDSGYDYIPNESRVFTFFFADLVSYTALAEQNSPDEILDMLNLSIGATSSTILHNGGFVDKIMGDSIFAVFEDPLKALISGIEIQKQFNILNLFRTKQDQPEVQLRIGIHTGTCILGSIGSDDFMELTFIGDAVNTAARLERAARPNSILASADTIQLAHDSVDADTLEEVELSVKGKSQPLRAVYINRVSFEGPRGKVTLGLDDHIF